VTLQGLPEERMRKLVALNLGGGYIVLISAITTRDNFTRIEGVMQHLLNTFKLNQENALNALQQAYPIPTATAALSQ
jgi:hypothetical protein